MKSTLTLEDMVTLLEVNDALDKLSDTLETIVGDIGIGSDGLMRELDKISSLIVKMSAAKKLQETVTDNNEWIYELLDDKSVDNERKAGILMGLVER